MVEKATIDAFYVEEPSSWRTTPETSAKVDQCLREIARVLRPDSGKFISLSFTPGRFRLPVLARSDFGWDVAQETFDNGGLPYTFYCMTKGQALSPEVALKVQSFQLKPTTNAANEAVSESDEEDFESASKMLSCISISSSDDESSAAEGAK